MSVHWDEERWFCPYCGQNNYWKSGEVVCMNCRRVAVDSCLPLSIGNDGNARLSIEFVIYPEEQDTPAFFDVRNGLERRPRDLSRITDAVRHWCEV